MTKNEMEAYLHNNEKKKDELEQLPDLVKQELQAHLDLYKTDPEKAHYWDPIVIGVPYGPVKTLLLTHKGRKTGRMLQTALQYYTMDGKTAIVASRGGTVDHPVWYLNLLDNPQCKFQIAKDCFDATARTVEGAERAKWWELIKVEQPMQIQYQSRTSRIIPVVVLEVA